jgi:hypothetical protein
MNSHERTLDEALEEIDRWSEQMVNELEGLSPEQVGEYLKRAQAKLEEKLGRPLNLPCRRAQGRTSMRKNDRE